MYKQTPTIEEEQRPKTSSPRPKGNYIIENTYSLIEKQEGNYLGQPMKISICGLIVIFSHSKLVKVQAGQDEITNPLG